MPVKKGLSIFATVLLLTTLALPVHAELDYSEFWDSSMTSSYPVPDGQLQISYSENGTHAGATNRLEALDDKSGWRSVCLEMGKFPCDRNSISSGKYRVWGSQLIMPVCETDTSPDCILSLSLIKPDGEIVPAEFIRYAQGITYPENPTFSFPETSTHALFRAPGVLNAAGTDTYAVEYVQELSWFRTTPDYQQIKVTVVPYAEALDPLAVTQKLIEGKTVYGTGVYTAEPWNFGSKQIFMEEGRVGKIANFAAGVGVEVVIHANNKFGGWLRGRISSAGFNSKQISSSQNQITLSGTSVEVPRIISRVTREQYLELTTVPVSLFDRHVGQSVGGDVSDPDGNFVWLNAIRQTSSDKAAGVHRVWMFGTVPILSRLDCFKTKGIQGLVATNAAVYAGAAPKYSGGFLNYRVGGLHYLPDGSEAIGSYDLVMRSDIVRCLYGLSKAPVSATLTVSGEGDSNVATVVVGEKNGWLSLSAKGFTFSTKTLKVRVTQKSVTIVCKSTKDPQKTRKVTAVSPKCPKGFKKT